MLFAFILLSMWIADLPLLIFLLLKYAKLTVYVSALRVLLFLIRLLFFSSFFQQASSSALSRYFLRPLLMFRIVGRFHVGNHSLQCLQCRSFSRLCVVSLRARFLLPSSTAHICSRIFLLQGWQLALVILACLPLIAICGGTVFAYFSVFFLVACEALKTRSTCMSLCSFIHVVCSSVLVLYSFSFLPLHSCSLLVPLFDCVSVPRIDHLFLFSLFLPFQP